MKSLIKNIILIINFLFVILLIGCYLGAFINIAKYPILGLLSLAYPFLFFINIGFIVFWLAFLKKYFLISLITICIRIDYIPSFFQLNKISEIAKTEGQIKIMNFNVHHFKYSKAMGPQIQSTLQLISKWSPDIICIQEFLSKKKENFETLNKIKKLVGNNYYLPLKSKSGNMSGNITISRFPIINEGIIDPDLKYSYKLMFTDIATETDTLRIYNIHLASFELNDDDAKVFEELAENHSITTNNSKKLIKKLISAQKEHANEVKILKKHISESPYKAIICGDFNDTPASYAYRQLKENMKDAFIQKGKGFGTTYNGRFPAFRIDYILHNKDYKTVAFKMEKVTYSDHYPIFAILQPIKE